MTSTADLFDMVRRDRVRRRRRGKVFEFFLKLFVVALAALLDGWVFMCIVATAHNVWVPQLPTLGFWWAVLFVWALRAVFTPLKWDSKRADR